MNLDPLEVIEGRLSLCRGEQAAIENEIDNLYGTIREKRGWLRSLKDHEAYLLEERSRLRLGV